MNETTKRLAYWTPRVLCIAFAVFLSIFALDVFDMPVDFWQKALALLLHLIPTALVLVALAIVWRHEWIGAILFPMLAALHLVTMWGRLNWVGYVLIEGPLLLLGVLFLMNWRNRATPREKGLI
ncbi:MAG TPA: hypothetical protein VFZ34_12975 [Blastocatellia bacterium]|nr:hypothetical protein [Blastocatellia bacterium]